MMHKTIEDCNRIEAVGDAAEALLYLLFERSEIEQDGCIRYTEDGQQAFDYLYDLIEWILYEHVILPLDTEGVAS